jgi:hypothetical protein
LRSFIANDEAYNRCDSFIAWVTEVTRPAAWITEVVGLSRENFVQVSSGNGKVAQ